MRRAASSRLHSAIFLLLLLTACTEGAFAPQDASIVVRVTGIPADGLVTVTAFVQDSLRRMNRVTAPIVVGSIHRFDDLGEGFGIFVGVRNLGTHRCTIVDTGEIILNARNDSTRLVTTEPNRTDTVWFAVRCRSANLTVDVSGLPASDSANVLIVSGTDSLRARLRGGTNTIAVVPHPSVAVLPDSVIGSDGLVYFAPSRIVAAQTGQTTSAQLQYQAPPQNQASLFLSVDGVPQDSGIVFKAFVRAIAAPFTADSVQVPMRGFHNFTSVPRSVDVDAGFDGLDAHACTVTRAFEAYTINGGRFTVRRRTSAGGVNPSIGVTLKCRSAAIDLQTSGLPQSDSAQVILLAPADTQIVWVRNGTIRIKAVPGPGINIMPGSVSASNGLIYRAAPQSVFVPSRQTTAVSLSYSTTNSCAVRPVAYYPLAGNGLDASGNGNHGTRLGPTPTADRHGNANAALMFDGIDDVIDLGDRFNTLTLPFSVAAWVYQPAGARGDLRSIFVTEDEANRYAGIWMQTSALGQPQITFADGGPVGGASRRSIDADAPMPPDTWVHLVATVRGPTDMTLYVNGAAVSGTYSGSGGPLLHTAAPARIGSFSILPANRPWLGALDELRIYDCSLTSAEVAALFAQQ